MVRVFTVTSTLEFPFESVTSAFFRKYQPSNPFVGHVEGYDVVVRTVDASGRLRSSRLISKTGVLPKWGKMVISTPQAFVEEQSVVDPVARTMETMTRNLTHKSIMYVEERQLLRQHPENPAWTLITTEARIVSSMWGLTSRLEQLGLTRFQKNYEKSRQALRYTIERLLPNLTPKPDQIPSS